MSAKIKSVLPEMSNELKETNETNELSDSIGQPQLQQETTEQSTISRSRSRRALDYTKKKRDENRVASGLGSFCFALIGALAVFGCIIWIKNTVEQEKGVCRAYPRNENSFECKQYGKTKIPVIHRATITLDEDGTVKECNTFQLDGACEGWFTQNDATAVLNGESRSCFIDGDNKCKEPGLLVGVVIAAIILGLASLCCYCFFCAFCVSAIFAGQE